VTAGPWSTGLVHHLLEAAASARPDHPAVVDRGRTATYGELDRRANQLARVLVEGGVRPGDRVGILLPKSIDAVAGLYAAMKAGAAAVPLDPQAPPARVSRVAAHCQLAALLTGSEKADTAAAVVAAAAPPVTVMVDGPPLRSPDGATGTVSVGAETVDASRPDPVPGLEIAPTDLAYILYTSGSTGVPKGVMSSHSNALALLRWATAEFALTGEDRLSSHAPFTFALSVFDVYGAAVVGATVVLVPPTISMFPMEVRRLVERERITVWFSVPSALTLLAARGQLSAGDLPSLRAVLFAGEAFHPVHLRALMAGLPHARFANLYGATETNVSTWYPLDHIPGPDAGPLPIGGPIDGVRLAVVGEDGTPVPPGTAGELYVQGPTVAQGYWNAPELTAEAFVIDPGPGLDGRWYRTGDQVEQRVDGNLRFIGRRDHQVKSRGHRIELGEIESTLFEHPGVFECAVVAVPDELVTTRLHAFVVVADGVDESELARFCAARLPSVMVPESFAFRDALPRTSTGKVDRQVLRQSVVAAG
jgi:L-proline---[L-prolyl-carrier protein] ligase